MRTKRFLTAVVPAWVCAGAAAAADYDFYAGLRYPGGELRPDVDIYQVKQEGEGLARAYPQRSSAFHVYSCPITDYRYQTRECDEKTTDTDVRCGPLRWRDCGRRGA